VKTKVEIWKDIAGYEGLYQVSNLGRVKSLKRNHGNSQNLRDRILTLEIAKNGYHRTRLWIRQGVKRFSVHRLVAQAFISNPQQKPQVNHMDGNPRNNQASNLEWVTQSENALHALRTGLMVPITKYLRPAKPGKENIRARAVLQLDPGFYPVRVWDTLTEAERALGFYPGAINRVLTKGNPYFKNFFWKYYDRHITNNRHQGEIICTGEGSYSLL